MFFFNILTLYIQWGKSISGECSKTSGFLTLTGGMEMENWPLMGYIKFSGEFRQKTCSNSVYWSSKYLEASNKIDHIFIKHNEGTIRHVFHQTLQYIYCTLYNHRYWKENHGRVLLSVQLQAEACNFTKSKTAP